MAPRQELDEGGLADARGAGEHGVALPLSQEDFKETVDLVGPVGEVVEIPVFGKLRQVSAVLEQDTVVAQGALLVEKSLAVCRIRRAWRISQGSSCRCPPT
jgi:hypothetical protein